MEIKINPEFKSLIPPLSEDERKGLEQSILSEGCRDAIVLWNDTIVDGHNRYEICTKYGVRFRTVQKEFPDEDSAMIWIIDNQFGRRNLGAGTRIILAKKREDILHRMASKNKSDSAIASNRARAAEQKAGVVQLDKTEITPVHVRKEIAKIAKVGEGTVARFDQVEKKRPDLIPKIVSEEISINKAYEETLATTAPKDVNPDPLPHEEDNAEKRESFVRDAIAMFDAITAFTNKHEIAELKCLVYASEEERNLISIRAKACKQVLTTFVNSVPDAKG